MNESQVVELRPDLDAYRRWFARPDHITLMLVTMLVGGGAVAAVVSGSVIKVLLFLLLIGGSAAVGIGGVTLSMVSSRILLGDDSITHERWFVRRTELRISDGLRGLLADYAPPVSDRSSDLLVIQRADGTGPVVRLNGAFWRHQDLALIAARAGVPTASGRLRVRHYERRLPKIMRPWERHWVAFAVFGPLLVLILTIAVLSIARMVGWLPERSVSEAIVREQDDTRAQVMATIDVSWTTESEVAACTSGAGSYRTASARAFVRGGSAALPDPATTVDRLTAVLVQTGYTEVRPDIDGDDLYVSARKPSDAVKRPEVTVLTSDGAVFVDVVSGCDRE